MLGGGCRGLDRGLTGLLSGSSGGIGRSGSRVGSSSARDRGGRVDRGGRRSGVNRRGWCGDFGGGGTGEQGCGDRCGNFIAVFVDVDVSLHDDRRGGGDRDL